MFDSPRNLQISVVIGIMPQNILMLCQGQEDYLADSIFYGLRKIYGSRVVDYPKNEAMYKGFNRPQDLHGMGFSMYSLLDDIDVDRYQIRKKIINGYFDTIIFGSIHSTFGAYIELLHAIGTTNIITLDGEDHPAPFPYTGNMWRYSARRTFPKMHTRASYFKRELTPETLHYRWLRIIGKPLGRHLVPKSGFIPINFGFPDEQILDQLPKTKTKEFMSHIVDPELIGKIDGASHSYAFDKQQDYYKDIQMSRFGVTTKKGGWDCLRHYEIAANGAVPCFKDLDLKPTYCAPHGLDETNTIIYRDYRDLKQKIASISDTKYEALQHNALAWAKRNSATNVAKYMLGKAGINLEDDARSMTTTTP